MMLLLQREFFILLQKYILNYYYSLNLFIYVCGSLSRIVYYRIVDVIVSTRGCELFFYQLYQSRFFTKIILFSFLSYNG